MTLQRLEFLTRTRPPNVLMLMLLLLLFSRENVLTVGDLFDFFDITEVEEMRGTVNLVVEFFRVGELKFVSHRCRMSYPHEIVVPRSLKKKIE